VSSEGLRKPRKLAAVGGERELLQAARADAPAQTFDQAHHIAPDQRLAARDADAVHTLGDERSTQPLQLLERQQFRLGQKGHVLRHAIDAAEVAAVRHGDAQIGDVPAEWIDHAGTLAGASWGFI